MRKENIFQGVAYGNLREWIEEAEKLDEVRHVKGAT